MMKLAFLSGTLGTVVLSALAPDAIADHCDCDFGYSISAYNNLGYTYISPLGRDYYDSRPYDRDYGSPFHSYYSPESGFSLGVDYFGFGGHNYWPPYGDYSGYGSNRRFRGSGYHSYSRRRSGAFIGRYH